MKTLWRKEKEPTDTSPLNNSIQNATKTFMLSGSSIQNSYFPANSVPPEFAIPVIRK